MAQCELMLFQTKRHVKTRWDLANKCVDDSFVGIERRMGGGGVTAISSHRRSRMRNV